MAMKTTYTLYHNTTKEMIVEYVAYRDILFYEGGKKVQLLISGKKFRVIECSPYLGHEMLVWVEEIS